MHQFVMYDLGDLLTWCDRFGDGLAGCLFLLADKVACHWQRNVCLEQRDHLARGGLHVIFGQRTLFVQPIKDAG